MEDYRKKRLYNPDDKIKAIMQELGPEMMEYFDDIRKPKKLKRKSNSKSSFSLGEIVTVKGSHGTIIYGPYKSDSKKDTYEVEMEDGDIITVEDDGKSMVKYSHVEEKTEEEDDDF
jgi:hypothetical protein